MLGHPTPAEADPTGESFAFERSVEKGSPGSGGGKGFADVFYRGRFAWEYKGRHADLAAAYRQLQLYREDLENPPLLVVSDMDRYEIHTNFTGTVKTVHSFTNEELPEAENLRVLRALFTDPRSLAPGRTPEGVTEEAAERFASLADGLRSRGEDPQVASHFLTRLLFCLFSEDVGLLPKGLFTRLIKRSRSYPEKFQQYAGQLFEAMAEGGEFWGEDVRHFNGGLFESGAPEDTDAEGSVTTSPRGALALDREELGELLAAAKLDWGSVEPAIFGTLFERSLDPQRRAQLGAHYTSREDILALIEPVLMAPLRRRWQEVRSASDALLEKMSTQSSRAATNTLRKVEGELQGFASEIRDTTVLDPACGSGNFLYTALKEMMDLEKEVATYASRAGLSSFFSEVSPEQLHGLEISPYARELAQASIWIGYLQWMSENGYGTPPDPILGSMRNIRLQDAVIERQGDGTVLEPRWPEAAVIVGNPPFLGDKKMGGQLGHEHVRVLRQLYTGRVPGGADLVAFWFERARAEIAAGRAARVGLLATNGIRQGANRMVLQRIKDTGDIFFAESDRRWVLEGAAVRVSMVGFDDGTANARVLDGAPVEHIHADLTGTLDLLTASRLPENAGRAFIGTQKGGDFDITSDVAEKLLDAPANPNGRPNADVVKPWANGTDVTRRPRGMWIIDFEPSTGQEEASLYEAPFEYLKAHVYPHRSGLRRDSHRRYWWIHAESRPGMRRALSGLSRYLVTPRVAKHRLFVWLEAGTVPDSRLAVIATEDEAAFGVLHSQAHEAWSLRTCSWHGVGDDPTYNPTTCFETFPFPDPTEEQRAEIEGAARVLDERRSAWLHPQEAGEADLRKRTLTNLYNDPPTWLTMAHERLDRSVFTAYGWPEEPSELAEEEMLGRLLVLNQERAAAEEDTVGKTPE